MNTKLVDFAMYCAKCEHEHLLDTENPCDECLTVPAQEDSHKPINFKPKEDK